MEDMIYRNNGNTWEENNVEIMGRKWDENGYDLTHQQRRREKAPNITFIASTQCYIVTRQCG